MKNEEAKKMLKAKLECLKRETSGTDIDCNYRNCDECNLCYEQGNMGEQKEALDMAIKALEQTELNSSYNSIKTELKPCEDYIPKDVFDKIRAEIAEYGSICVAYLITDKTKTDKGIEELVTNVLSEAKRQVLDIIDKYKAESEDDENNG